MSSSFVYIATQNPQQMGITLAAFDSTSGKLAQPRLAIETRDPGYCVLSANGRHLYVCNAGTPGGISAFTVDTVAGSLALQNHLQSQGRGPSYVSLDRSGRFVLDANYGGGFVEVLALNDDGSLKARAAQVQHSGSSVHPQRQGKAHAHWIGTDPGNAFALAADLGTDRIEIYRFDAAAGTLAPHDPPAARVTPGSGPRHLAWHPNGRWVYAVQELSNEVLAFHWNLASGQLSQFQSVSTLAEGTNAANTAAEIAVRADGRFLYVSNRGEDSIVVFAIDAGTGQLSVTQRIPSGGRAPRYFAIDPTNHWMLVVNQDDGKVAVFSIDGASGHLAPAGPAVTLTKPAGLVFARRGA